MSPDPREAMQWDGTRSSIEAICRWANDGADEPWVDYVFTGVDDVQDVYCHTLEGPLCVSPGDFVIRNVQGEFYPRTPDVFEGHQ